MPRILLQAIAGLRILAFALESKQSIVTIVGPVSGPVMCKVLPANVLAIGTRLELVLVLMLTAANPGIGAPVCKFRYPVCWVKPEIVKLPTCIKLIKMEIDPNKAIDYMTKYAPEYAQAKADRVFIENYLRTLKSRLMTEESGTLGAKEAYAYAHPQYIELLEGLRVAVEEEDNLRWMLEAAKLKIEIWKTHCHNQRAEIRATT